MHFATLLASLDAKAGRAVPAAPANEVALCAEAPRLRRLVHRLLGWPGTTEVDDVVQEVLLAAWRHRQTFRGEASLGTWLTRIAIRKAQNHVRAATVRRRLFGWWLPSAADEPAAPALADDVHAAQLDRTQRAMHRLAQKDREVLVLRYLEQRDMAQIADALGCSRAAVDARLTRARQRLRAELGLEERA
ncbi:MAG TPA: sigma-70 family RNA polymerase sigma factor [Planctomycetota bacterium]|nr:sigma-70 family RNA polymerase sigma factor [Planctomycetota bacterium]